MRLTANHGPSRPLLQKQTRKINSSKQRGISAGLELQKGLRPEDGAQRKHRRYHADYEYRFGGRENSWVKEGNAGVPRRRAQVIEKTEEVGGGLSGGVEVEKEVASETKLNGFLASAKDQPDQRGTDFMTKHYVSILCPAT